MKKNNVWITTIVVAISAVCISVVGLVLWMMIMISDVVTAATAEPVVTQVEIITEEEEIVMTITCEDVYGVLMEADEWTTYSGCYTVTETSEDNKTFGSSDVVIPFTTNTISGTGDIIVKAGYYGEDIEVEVDNEDMIIYVTLPEAAILDCYLDLDTLELVSDESWFNEIEDDQYTVLELDMEAQGLATAESDGILELARNNAKLTILELLEQFEDYKVKFV